MAERGPARIALAGTGGYGGVHLANLRCLQETRRTRLVAVCDVGPPPEAFASWLQAEGVRQFAELEPMLAEAAPDVTIIATPPHLHPPMLRGAFAAGCDVLVEKPPVVTRTQLAAASAQAEGHRCQVGFQALGSWAVARLRTLIASGDLGTVDLVAAGGCWIRGDRYYGRARWAGRRTLDREPVNDGALTNPFAHAVMGCLAIAGIDALEGAGVDADLYRAHPIEVHDTGAVRVRLPGRPTVLVAVTLCAGTRGEPWVLVRGTDGAARWDYLGDEIEITRGGGPPELERGPRSDLLENLLAVRDGEAPELIAPLAKTRPFVELVEEVSARPVRDVTAARRRERTTDDGDRWPEIVGVEAATARAVVGGRLYEETGVTWSA